MLNGFGTKKNAVAVGWVWEAGLFGNIGQVMSVSSGHIGNDQNEPDHIGSLWNSQERLPAVWGSLNGFHRSGGDLPWAARTDPADVTPPQGPGAELSYHGRYATHISRDSQGGRSAPFFPVIRGCYRLAELLSRHTLNWTNWLVLLFLCRDWTLGR